MGIFGSSLGPGPSFGDKLGTIGGLLRNLGGDSNDAFSNYQAMQQRARMMQLLGQAGASRAGANATSAGAAGAGGMGGAPNAGAAPGGASVSALPPETYIPAGAVQKLLQQPELAEHFDEKYGAGAAMRVLSGAA